MSQTVKSHQQMSSPREEYRKVGKKMCKYVLMENFLPIRQCLVSVKLKHVYEFRKDLIFFNSNVLKRFRLTEKFIVYLIERRRMLKKGHEIVFKILNSKCPSIMKNTNII